MYSKFFNLIIRLLLQSNLENSFSISNQNLALIIIIISFYLSRLESNIFKI